MDLINSMELPVVVERRRKPQLLVEEGCWRTAVLGVSEFDGEGEVVGMNDGVEGGGCGVGRVQPDDGGGGGSEWDGVGEWDCGDAWLPGGDGWLPGGGDWRLPCGGDGRLPCGGDGWLPGVGAWWLPCGGDGTGGGIVGDVDGGWEVVGGGGGCVFVFGEVEEVGGDGDGCGIGGVVVGG
ncbi:hypothetical protein L1987_54556 [Smallanthus sonchifolius]|uniref:Uncharacterized protein n=1 Tax=Smallanthus sonchifolius TaxID=185202 RepID=A0ACB9E8I6_9ASTR|nr:hypothetical protein L1987_54556 [Smallanthus sonchifolius]